MHFLLPFLYITLFIFLILRLKFFYVASVSRHILILLFIVKLIAAACVWLVYLYHYSGAADFLTYFSDSTVLINKLTGSGKTNFSGAWGGSFDDSIFAGSKTMIITNAILHVFSFGNFYVHAVFFAFFSFAGLVALLQAFLKYFPEKKIVLIITVFLLPDVLFWGSAPLKEALLTGFLSFLIYYTDFGLKKSYGIQEMISNTLLLLLIFCTSPYTLFALLPVLIINSVIAHTSPERSGVKYLLGVLFFILIIFIAGRISPDTDILRRISDKRAKAISEARGGIFLQNDKRFICVDYDNKDRIMILAGDSAYVLKKGSSYLSWPLENMEDTTYVVNSADTSLFRMLYYVTPAHSVISMKKLDPKPLTYIKKAPFAFISSLVHPTLSEIDSCFHLLAAVENLWFLLIVILSVVFFDKTISAKKEVILFCLVFSAMLLVIVGFTTPAIGSLIRYRTVGVLFFITATAMMIDPDKFKRKSIGMNKNEDSYTE
jgi:hypothetical protein